MKFSSVPALLLIPLCLLMHATAAHAKSPPPTIKKETEQLIVDGKPFLILGGELGNSRATSVAYMDEIWPRLVARPAAQRRSDPSGTPHPPSAGWILGAAGDALSILICIK